MMGYIRNHVVLRVQLIQSKVKVLNPTSCTKGAVQLLHNCSIRVVDPIHTTDYREVEILQLDRRVVTAFTNYPM